MIEEEIVRITYNSKTHNLKVHNSYLITNPKTIESRLNQYKEVNEFQYIYRSKKSCINEWIAHNRLYKFATRLEGTIIQRIIGFDRLDIFIDRVKDTDLTKGESLFRRICYWILSR